MARFTVDEKQSLVAVHENHLRVKMFGACNALAGFNPEERAAVLKGPQAIERYLRKYKDDLARAMSAGE